MLTWEAVEKWVTDEIWPVAQGLPTSVLDHKLMEGRNVCTPVASSCA